jgi:malate dehydrogenase (oxaloacetate-decarboxylating)
LTTHGRKVRPVSIELRGSALLHDRIHNKGTAFSERERRLYGLDGLLPPAIETLEQQVVRAHTAVAALSSDLEKHFYLRELQDRNATVHTRLLVDHLEELLPIVYTPTVGLACEQYSHAYRRNLGLFISYPLRERLDEVLRNRQTPVVDVIVVTDGERILGLGDQGAGGIGIPIGKLALYCAVGGIRPERTLPILLDVGTNNEERLRDPQYVGWRHERIGGDDYYGFVDRFVEAVEQELPGTLLQWEDFASSHAHHLLTSYRERILSFNDDIEGTAAVAVGVLTAATSASGLRWRDQLVVILGAGSAAVGVADMVQAEIVADGAAADEARRRVLLVDRDGLLTMSRDGLSPEQRSHAQADDVVAGWDLAAGSAVDLKDVIHNLKATILIGLSTQRGAFSEEIVREMASKVRLPAILPLSNPTDHAEADPADLARWTDGRAIVATGSPFPPVEIDGARYPVAQCNNVFIFPAIGLGVVASQARRVTDGMFAAAARALGVLSPATGDPHASLLPPIGDLRRVTAAVAAAVAVAACGDGVAEEASEDELRSRVEATQWWPAYPEDELS